MITNFHCPACQRNEWANVEQFRFSTDDHIKPATVWSLRRQKTQNILRVLFSAKPRTGIVQCNKLNLYQMLRRRVFFEVWFPSDKVVNLTSKFCNYCGMMVYEPRPTTDDISAKYRYLNALQDKASSQPRHIIKLDRIRADRIFNVTINHFNNKDFIRVLDYGGGSGVLLLPFLERGHKGFVVDYDNNQLPGITKLADDISDMVTTEKYDLIICSHVLEHVAEPDKLLASLHDLLSENGIIYAEVPQEIWAGVRIETDPVTHINFFTENSFKTLFETQGFSVIQIKQQISHYTSNYLEVIWLLATPNGGIEALNTGQNDIANRLYPSRIQSLMRLFGLLLLPQINKIRFR